MGLCRETLHSDLKLSVVRLILPAGSSKTLISGSGMKHGVLDLEKKQRWVDDDRIRPQGAIGYFLMLFKFANV